jgi:hypothetical protein
MLGVTSLVESQESSRHDPSLEVPEEAAAITAEQVVTSVVDDTKASLPTKPSLPIVIVAGGSGAADSHTLAITTAG